MYTLFTKEFILLFISLSICVEKLGPLENEVLQLRSDISKLEAANKQLKREAEADQHHRQILIFDNAKLLQDVVLSQQKYITSEELLQKALKKDDDNLQLLLDERMVCVVQCLKIKNKMGTNQLI